jgi:uncharacterized protein (TIGR01777 family)
MTTHRVVAVTGATGFVGSALCARLAAAGARVVRIGRDARSDVLWDPTADRLEGEALRGVDAVVHLAGASLADGRWTAARRQQILESRVASTALLARTMAALGDAGPRVLVSGSAIGYYGDSGADWVDEDSAPGTGFLPDVVRAWEAAAAPAEGAGIRVVRARLGVVLGRDGGALAKMLPPFRAGVGGPIGSGRQYFSWIALDDAAGALEFLAGSPDARGPVNVVAPHPVTNTELVRALGRALGRPAVLPLPAAAVRVLFGEMGEATLLAGQRVQGARLASLGFACRWSELGPFLDAELRR